MSITMLASPRPVLDSAKSLLIAVADEIETSPRRYDQRHWCGQACCIAGHVALQVATPDQRRILRRGDLSAGPLAVRLATDAVFGPGGRRGPGIPSLFSATPSADWPDPWATRWMDIDMKDFSWRDLAPQRATVAAGYLRHLASA